MTAQVKRHDGVIIPFSTSTGAAIPARLLGLSHHITKDMLFGGDDTGRMWRKPEGEATLYHVAQITSGGGEVYHMVRDGTNPRLIWAACAEGLYKCYDSEATTPVWYMERAGKALMVGYGSSPWAPFTATYIRSVPTTTDPNVKDLAQAKGATPPTGWTAIVFDDSAWGAAVSVSAGAFGDPDCHNIWNDTVYHDNQNLIRHKFTLADGKMTSASLQVYVDDDAEVWINGVYIVHVAAFGSPATVTIDPSILLPGQDNVIAIKAYNVFPATEYVAYKLTIT